MEMISDRLTEVLGRDTLEKSRQPFHCRRYGKGNREDVANHWGHFSFIIFRIFREVIYVLLSSRSFASCFFAYCFLFSVVYDI